MSPSSRQIVRSMLQVEPGKRIKIQDLLGHNWVKMGPEDNPVSFRPDHEVRIELLLCFPMNKKGGL